MKLLTLLVLGLWLVLPASAAEFQSVLGEMPPAPVGGPDSPCTSSQGGTPNAGLGIQGAFGPQGDCIAGNAGDPASLVGFALALNSCQDGWVMTTSVAFQTADAGDLWHLYLWRDLGGMPFDACGMECAKAMNLSVAETGPTWQTHDWSSGACPCVTFDQELLYAGVVYVDGSTPADWYIGYDDSVSGQAGKAFGNLSGAHNDWPDLSAYGYGYSWGVQNTIDTECGSVPVEPSTWGAMKNLYR